MSTPAKAMITVEQVPTEVYVSAGGRRSHQVKATAVRRGPLLATRRKVSDAKAAFAALVEKIIDTHGAPEVLFFEGFTGICYQMVGVDHVTWSYRIVCPDGSSGGELGGAPSMAAAVRSCKLHMSQHGTDYHDDASVMRAWRFLNPDQRHDHLRYSASQRAYKYGRDIEGAADPHQWAGDHQHDFLPPLEALATDEDSRPDTAGADAAMTTDNRRPIGLDDTESRGYVIAFGDDAELAAASRRDHGPLGPVTGPWRLLTVTEAAELAAAKPEGPR